MLLTMRLDPRVCAEIGAELARVRASRGLTVAEVGEKLLLSSRQVKALEDVEPGAFHNSTFHLKALKKYVAFAELPAARLAAFAPFDSNVAPTRIETVTSADDIDKEGASRGGLVFASSALVLVAALAAGAYFLWARPKPVAGTTLSPPPISLSTLLPVPLQPSPPGPPAQLTPLPAAVMPPLEVERSGSSSAVPAAFGMLSVLQPTWIFVRDADNAVIERSLAGGQSIELESQPTYLAVGLPDVELRIGLRRIDLSSYVVNGQVRMRAGDFDALVQDASPIQAPLSARQR